MADGSSTTRRLPIYLLIDCSESMVGEPLEAVAQGVKLLCMELKTDPMAMETAYLSVISFSSRAHQLVPLTDLMLFSLPPLPLGPGTGLGAVFDLLGQCVSRDVRKGTSTQKGDWKPLVFLLTDGQPTDNWQDAFNRFKATNPSVNIIAAGCGEDADADVLKAITPSVLMLKSAGADSFKAFFKWVSQSVSVMSVGIKDGEKFKLPTPPADVLAAPVKSGVSKSPSQIILAARCRDQKKGYLMRYRRSSPSNDTYQAEKAYKVSDDYFSEASASPTGMTLDSSKLKEASPCPYCGRKGWGMGKDKTSLECSDSIGGGSGRAQVMFVLDVTGSMAGEIGGIKDNIKDFVDYIKKEGLAVEVGLIAFRDLEERQPPEVLNFKGQVFTDNASDFKAKVGGLTAYGGGSTLGESSFDALVLASNQPFSRDMSRVIVLITDEPPKIPDGKVKNIDGVISALSEAHIDQLHMVLPSKFQSNYRPLHSRLKGKTFELGEDGRGGTSFRGLLMDIGKAITVAARLG